jgi:DNA topoisomerase I
MTKSENSSGVLRPQELAKHAHLKYVSDEEPGYTRRRNGGGFRYLNCRGKPLRSKDHTERIKSLVIPPAWEKVWICRFENGHLQATGYDVRERKQYLYHQNWQEAANRYKFERLTNFGNLLPSIRRKIAARLKGTKPTRERVLAGILAILDATSIRVGNEEYVAANNSFGLTTLRNRHLEIAGRQANLKFRGKSGVLQELCVKSKACVQLLKQCQKLRGAHVFQYLDDKGALHAASSTEVNEFLQQLIDEPFTAKDFRTWAASSLVAGIFYEQKDADSISERKKTINAAIKSAAKVLGNTVATSRKYYVHPGLLETFEEGSFPKLMNRFTAGKKRGFTRNEQLLAYFLRRSAQ